MRPTSPRQIRIIKLTVIFVLASIFFSYVKMEDVVKFFSHSNAQFSQQWSAKNEDSGQQSVPDTPQEVNLSDVYYPSENSTGIDKNRAAWEHKTAQEAAESGRVTAETSKAPNVEDTPPPEKRTGVHDAEAVTNSDNAEFAARRHAAEQGDARAQFEMGEAYHDGAGVEADPKEAIKWYRKAAEQGQPEAQDKLGTAYHEGWGVRKDETAALSWWRKAADQNNPHAREMLKMYESNPASEGKN